MCDPLGDIIETEKLKGSWKLWLHVRIKNLSKNYHSLFAIASIYLRDKTMLSFLTVCSRFPHDLCDPDWDMLDFTNLWIKKGK